MNSKTNSKSPFPIIHLDTDEHLSISFDELSHEYKRYIYEVTHLNPDFTTDSLVFSTDYLSSTRGYGIISESMTSINTSVPYTHYSFSFPNQDIKPLISGNYLITIKEDIFNHPTVAKIYFGIVDSQTHLSMNLSGNTDIERAERFQQIHLNADIQKLLVTDPSKEIYLIVFPNNRWDLASIHPNPDSQTANYLLWNHSKKLIFPAENEFHSFEMITMEYPGMNIDKIYWKDPYYITILKENTQEKSYITQQDLDGNYLIRKKDSSNPAIEADYSMVHFTLNAPALTSYDSIFINGWWTNNQFTTEYQMTYNLKKKDYEANILMKCGYYNFQYVNKKSLYNDNKLKYNIDGNFYQTENIYTALLYYKRLGTRYWKLVGSSIIKSHGNI